MRIKTRLDRALGKASVLAKEDGWTFIETLIVLGIILILTATVGFMSVRYLDKAKTVAAKSQIESFALALDSFKIDCGEYPTEEQGLAALYTKPSTGESEGWAGPYIAKQVPKDPWNHEYVYHVPGPNSLPYSLVSYGSDGVEGGEGKAADITSY
jgi:general secretion pathway protein G